MRIMSERNLGYPGRQGRRKYRILEGWLKFLALLSKSSVQYYYGWWRHDLQPD